MKRVLKEKIGLLFLVLPVVLLSLGEASGQYIDPRKAKEYYKKNNYLDALPIYKKLIKQEPNNPEYYKRIGICYLRTHIDRTSAAEYLEKALKKEGHDKDVRYYLGKAYMMQGDYDKAIKNLESYMEKGGLFGGKDDASHLLQQCKNGQQLIKYPLDVTYENMGEGVNTEYPDYYPYVAKDESRLVFTSRRRKNRGGGKEFDGYYPSDIWVVNDEGEGLVDAENARKVNTPRDEQAVGLSDDGNKMFVYIDHVKEYGDIYVTEWDRIGFDRIEKLGGNVNTDEIETSASISSDRKTLFFASERKGGQGGIDLYMCRKLPTGDWAKAQNLGPKINTKHNEGFPTLSFDNKTLYFCSQGHNSMGGYDIFKAEWDPTSNTWSEPKNIGYPINDGLDNRTISFTRDGLHAYVSTFRKDGLGDLDIYRVTFNEIANQPAIFKLRLPSEDTAKQYITDAMVTVLDKKFQVVGQYSANKDNGAYTIALPPGQYTLEIEAEGFPLYEEKWKVTQEHQDKTLNRKSIDLPEKKNN